MSKRNGGKIYIVDRKEVWIQEIEVGAKNAKQQRQKWAEERKAREREEEQKAQERGLAAFIRLWQEKDAQQKKEARQDG